MKLLYGRGTRTSIADVHRDPGPVERAWVTLFLTSRNRCMEACASSPGPRTDARPCTGADEARSPIETLLTEVWYDRERRGRAGGELERWPPIGASCRHRRGMGTSAPPCSLRRLQKTEALGRPRPPKIRRPRGPPRAGGRRADRGAHRRPRACSCRPRGRSRPDRGARISRRGIAPPALAPRGRSSRWSSRAARTANRARLSRRARSRATSRRRSRSSA